MNTDKPDIGIIYGKGSFKDSELEALANEFATHGLSLAAKERSPFINAAVGFLCSISPNYAFSRNGVCSFSRITIKCYL